MKWLVAILFLIFVFSCQEKEEKCDNWKLLYNHENIDTLDINKFNNTFQFIEFLDEKYDSRQPSKYFLEKDSIKIIFNYHHYNTGCFSIGYNPYEISLTLSQYDQLLIKSSLNDVSFIKLENVQDSLLPKWEDEFNLVQIIPLENASINELVKLMNEVQRASNQFVERTSTKRFNKSFCDLDSLQVVQIKDSLNFDLMLLRKYKEEIPPPPPPKYSDNENN